MLSIGTTKGMISAAFIHSRYSSASTSAALLEAPLWQDSSPLVIIFSIWLNLVSPLLPPAVIREHTELAAHHAVKFSIWSDQMPWVTSTSPETLTVMLPVTANIFAITAPPSKNPKQPADLTDCQLICLSQVLSASSAYTSRAALSPQSSSWWSYAQFSSQPSSSQSTQTQPKQLQFHLSITKNAREEETIYQQTCTMIHIITCPWNNRTLPMKWDRCWISIRTENILKINFHNDN